MPSEIDSLSALARKQASELNQTLDKLQELEVTATVFKSNNAFFGAIYSRVQLVLIDPPHSPKPKPKSEKGSSK